MIIIIVRVKMNNIGQIAIDIFLVLFVIILGFLVFYSLINLEDTKFKKMIVYLTITENAVSKKNPSGIGFAEYDKDIHTTLKNKINISDLRIIDPIKEIDLYDLNNNLTFKIGDADCIKKIVIPRLIIYDENEETQNEKIGKLNFIFCE